MAIKSTITSMSLTTHKQGFSTSTNQGPAMQAPMQGGGIPGVAQKYACSRCAISYTVREGDRVECPLCLKERELSRLRLAIEDLHTRLYNSESKVALLSVQIDHIAAIREALEITGSEDLTFLKSVMYRYREDRSIGMLAMAQAVRTKDGKLKVTKRQKRTVLVVTQEGKDNEEYLCTSAGGVAIVGYYHEITNELGSKQAMGYLLRALSLHLPGGAR
jgi:hypothetical protein